MAYLGNAVPTKSTTTIRQTTVCVGGETTITVSGGYNSFGIDVYKNGVKLVNGVDFTASDGQSITLDVQCLANDVIEVVSLAATSNVTNNVVSSFVSFRNLLINGNFDVWQRGTSKALTTPEYLADRWITGLTGSTATVSRQSFALGQTDVPHEPTYFHRAVVASVAGAANYAVVQQKLEFVRTLAGRTGVLTFWAKAEASKNIAVEFVQNFGTGGSPSSAVSAINVTTCALTTSWQKFTIVTDFPSISGKTLGTDGNDNLTVNFFLEAGSNWASRTNSLGQQSGTFDIAQVQLEEGSFASNFELRPIQVETALCHRYYWETRGTVGNNNAVGSAFMRAGLTIIAGGALFFPVEMRAAPTLGGSTTFVTAAPSAEGQIGFLIERTSGFVTITGAITAIGGITSKKMSFAWQAGTSFGAAVAGDALQIQAYRLTFTAEL